MREINLSLHFQTDIMTRAELAFGALDRNKKGFITAKEGQREEGKTRRIFRLYFVFETFKLTSPSPSWLLQDLGKLTKKLSKEEVNSLLVKLDTDGDGQLSFDEFKVLFENAEKRKKVTEKKSQENLIRHHSAKVSAAI